MAFVSPQLEAEHHLWFEQKVYCYRQHADSAQHNKSPVAIKKHMEDLLLAMSCHERMLDNVKCTSFPKQLYDDFKQKKDEAVYSVMLEAAKLRDLNISDFINYMRKINVYPALFTSWHFRTGSLKTLIFSMVSILFPFEPCYRLFVLIYRHWYSKSEQ